MSQQRAHNVVDGESHPLRHEGIDTDDDMRELVSMISHTVQPPSTVDVPPHALPDQEYLEAFVLPLLICGLEELARAQPVDALAYLAAYLISNNPQRGAVPLLHNANGVKVPITELTNRAAAHFDVCTQTVHRAEE